MAKARHFTASFPVITVFALHRPTPERQQASVSDRPRTHFCGCAPLVVSSVAKSAADDRCPPSPQPILLSCAIATRFPYVSSPPVRALSCMGFRSSSDAAIHDSVASTVSGDWRAQRIDRQATSRCQNGAPRQSPQFQYLARNGNAAQPIVSDNLHIMRRQNKFSPPRCVQAPPRQARRSVDKSILVHLRFCGCRPGQGVAISGSFPAVAAETTPRARHAVAAFPPAK